MINVIVKEKNALNSRVVATGKPLIRYLKDSRMLSIDELKTYNKKERYINIDEPDLIPDEFKDILWFSFEGTRLYEKWIPEVQKYNLILTPSQHTYDLFVNSGIDKSKIKLLPFGIDLRGFYPTERKAFLDKFVFMFNGGWIQNPSDRKGLIYLLKAYREEFGKDDKVALLIKLNQGSHWDGYKFETGLRTWNLKKFINPIFVDSNIYKENYEFNYLYSQCDVFISPSRAESFNMPVLEAMANGKICIVTGWGGHIDFCESPPNYHIKYKLESAPILWCSDMYKDSQWAIPDINHLKELMRNCYNNIEIFKNINQDNIKIARKYEWLNIIKKLRRII